MSLPGPSRTIIVEPIEQPNRAPAPVEPDNPDPEPAPERKPAPKRPEREPEKVPGY